MKKGRQATVLVFLSDVKGGEELFPFASAEGPESTKLANEALYQNFRGGGQGENLEDMCRNSSRLLRVAARQGRALIWWNHRPDLQHNDRSIHASCPVKNGTKTVVHRFIRWWSVDTGNLLNNMISQLQDSSSPSD